MATSLREPTVFELGMIEAMDRLEVATSMSDQNEALLAMLECLAARLYPEGFDFVFFSSYSDRVNGTEGSLRFKCANNTELHGLQARLAGWIQDELTELREQEKSD